MKLNQFAQPKTIRKAMDVVRKQGLSTKLLSEVLTDVHNGDFESLTKRAEAMRLKHSADK